MTARKSHSRFRASGSGHDSLTPTAGRKRSAAQRVLVANAARVAEAAQTAAAQDRPRVSAYGLDGGTPEDDTAYEFVAPKFHDFLGADADMDGADEWFDTRVASPLEPGEPRGALDLDDDEFDEEEEFQEPQENADEPLMERSFRSRKSSMGKRSLPQRNSTSKASTSSAPGKPAAAPKPKPGPAEPRKKSLTMPKEFKFQTDLRAHPMSLRGQSHPGPKAGGGVQKKTKPGKQSNKKSSQKVTLTVPEPFQFRTAIKAMVREAPPPKSPFVPLAVQVKQFEATSPPADRRKARPRNVKIASPKLTAARSPRLLTKLRTKPAIPTSEERELAELGIKPKSNTITKRSGPRGPTIPKSPALHKSRPVAPQPPSPPRVIRANPIPEYQKFEPHLPHRATKPVDFELPGEEISRRKREQLEEQRRREEAEIRRMRHFVAQPIPDTLDQPSLPSNVGSHERPLTFPEPFQLSTDLRGETHQRRLQEQLEQERRDKENKARFKAQPFREVEPFIPSKTAKAPTEPVRVMLRSETRAEERRRFEEDLKEKERIAEELRQRQLKEQEEREEEEVRKLRKQAVHKAAPIRSYAPIVIKASERPLTDAMSPMIGEKRRRKQQLQNVSTGSN